MENDVVKITNAVYKLLECLPDADPLKNKVKEKALAILEAASVTDIEALQKYLELARSQGWMGGMNFLIIKKQYDELKQNLVLQKEPSLKKGEKQLAYSGRQKAILDLLKSQQKLQVADIIKEIPDITKRTVRRDLDDLLKKGVITRMGEFNQVFYQKS